MRPTTKPKKLQKKEKTTPTKTAMPQKYPTADLGDTDISTSMEEEVEEEEEEFVADDQGFHSPPPDTDGTDYGLEFTATGTQYLPDTSRRQPPVQPEITVNKSRHKNNNKNKPKNIVGPNMVQSSKDTSVPAVNTTAAKTATPTTAGVSKRVAQKRKAQRDLQFLKSYKKLASRVDFMISRAAFARVVREIMLSTGTDVQYITATALEALQTATEAYVQGRLEDANLLALHARRTTLMAKDMELINFLRTNQR